MIRSALLAPAFLTLCAVAPAGELHPERLPAEVTWVAHVDFEAFSRTTMWREVQRRQAARGDAIQTRFDFSDMDLGEEIPHEIAVQLEHLELDLFRDLKSFTAAGIGKDLEEPLALLEVSETVHDVIAVLREMPGYSSEKVEGLRVHAIPNPDTRQIEAYCYVQRAGDDGTHIVALAKDRKQLLTQARVLSGQAPSARNAGRRKLKLDPRPSSFMYFEATGELPGLEHVGAASHVTELVRSVRLDVGERDGYLEAQVQVASKDPEKTRHIAQILQGLSSMAALAATEDPELSAAVDLCEGLDFRTVDDTLVVDFEYEVVDLLDLLEEHL